MAAGTHEQRRLETLAQWLAGLRPADPCPCCGAPLDREPPDTRRDDAGRAESLVCEYCGCRLETADAAVGCVAAALYGLAA